MAASRSKTIRLTVGQAIVKYLQVQYSERDGNRRRFIPALFGIFGHGNLVGLGQALRQARRETASCMIVVEIDPSVRPPDSGLWWDFEVAQVSRDAGVRKIRQSYEKEVKKRRFYY